MNRLVLLFFFLLSVCSLQAQKETAIWYFGQNAGLDFNSGAPVPLTDGALNTEEGCASISDPNGNLLFYTDGSDVWDRNHAVMPNGTGLMGHRSSTQSAIIVPRPGSSHIFYVFTVKEIGGSMQYSELDMNLNGGFGDITAQKNIQLVPSVSEKLTAVEHANGVDIWVLSRGRWNNTHYAFLVTAAGVSPVSVDTNIGMDLGRSFLAEHALGYLKASPDGLKIASALSYNRLELFDFDNTTGVLSNMRLVSNDPANYYYGVEFSPSGQYLYRSDYDGSVYQYDTNNAIISTTEVLLYQQPTNRLGGLQLALDGKIYMAHRDKPFLSVINEPDVLGLGCDFVEIGVDLNGRLSDLGLPPFIQSFFQVAFTAENLCTGSPTDFELTTSETILSVSWDFGDGNTSTIENPSHTYTAGGVYTVNATVTTASGTLTETEEIIVYQTPMAHTTLDFEVCTVNTNHEFRLSDKDIEVLGAQNAADFQIGYFASLIDAENNTNPLPNLHTNTLTIETVFARIHNTDNPDCFDTTSFDLVVQQAPVVNTQHDWTVCDTDLDGFHSFDLAEKTIAILAGNSSSDFTVSYYLSQNDLDNAIKAIPTNYTNTNPREEIFWKIENNSFPTCFGEGTFFLEVISGVSANATTDFEVCDDTNDGIFTFDLTTKEAEILGSQNASGVNISFHRNLSDADSDSNPLSKSTYTNVVAYQETLFVRVENTSDDSCYDTTFFDLVVTNSPVQQVVSDWQVCDTDNDAIFSFDLTQKDSEVLGGQSSSDFSVSYHLSQSDADSKASPVTGVFDNTNNPQQIFYRVESISNSDCFSTNNFLLEVFDTPIAQAPNEMIVCAADQSGRFSFDFSLTDSEVLNGQDANQYQVSYFSSEADAIAGSNALPKNGYTNSMPEEIIYARVQHVDLENCYDLTHFTIRINALPFPNLEEMYVICPDSPELSIDGGDFETWSWKNANGQEIGHQRTIEISTLGEYNLTVSESANGLVCEETVFFEVISSGAPEDFTYSLSGFSDVISVTINALGQGDFEYSSDGENFQESNVLDVFPGTHTIYVRDLFLCRTISKEVIAMGYQKFFTPNNDGTHDYWNIIGLENFPNSRTLIFDRHGKLLAQLNPDSDGWNGRFQGIQMPASDYWFRFENEDGNVFTGHFSLKR